MSKCLPFCTLLSVFALACGGTPASPTPPTGQVSMTGGWTGVATDSTALPNPKALNWHVTQNGNTLTGTANLIDGYANPSLYGIGSLNASVNGSRVTFQISIPAGGFINEWSSCSISIAGEATMAYDGQAGNGYKLTGLYSGSMSGTMSGSMTGQSCDFLIQDGHVSLYHN